MTLAQIKETLNIKALDLSQSKDDKDQPTPWFRYWDNKNRVSVVLHQDVLAYIKENTNTTKLALKYEAKSTKTGDQAGLAYDSYILIHAESIAESL
jgi:hypothetical protein